MPEPFGSDDLRVLAKYEQAAQGAWTAMPQADKDSYLRIHGRLEDIVQTALKTLPNASAYAGSTTLGFNPKSGVRGNRPKDVWCAIYPKNASVRMPQVFLIVSPRGIELGYAAAIHPSDFSNQDFRTAVRAAAPQIFKALPDAASPDVQQLAQKISSQGHWFYRRKTRLTPKENDFSNLGALISFLHSSEGKSWGAGTVSRYWRVHEFGSDVDLGQAFRDAAELFHPLMVVAEETPAPPLTIEDLDLDSTEGLRADIERFMEMYPEKRARPFATDQELWSVISSLQQRLKTLSCVSKRPTLKVTWGVGQGNWARVPWVAFLDSRVTDSTQRGVYGVMLFREDMSGVYLTFNQGVTEPKRTHGATTGLQLLHENAKSLRASSQDLQASGFNLDSEIDLRTEGTLGQDYEAATIAHKLYERGAVPVDGAIAKDIEALLDVYEQYVKAISDAPIEVPEDDAPPYGMSEALADLFLEQSEIEELLVLWKMKKNLLLQGPPGVGKTYVARRLAYLLMGHRDQKRARMVQFHQAYAYEDFIQGFRPNDEGGFTRRDGAFFDFARLAAADSDRPYVFIIDEINRGNLSKILGELMVLIESDKRGEEHAVPLAYAKPGELPFSVPPNLFVLGLMNTADRSLAMVDYALRRRFAFHTLEPRFAGGKFREFLEKRGVLPELIATITERITRLNAEIAEDKARLGPGYQIGHSFFVPADSSASDTDWYRRVVIYGIAPLLREYWFDDPAMAERKAAELLSGI